MRANKEFLYVGHYTDIDGNYILKVGATNDLDRRRQEHTRNYRRAKQYTMPNEDKFEYDFFIPLSKYNTLRYEERTKERWQAENIGVYIRNDRFICSEKPETVTIKIRKVYSVAL